ncbi:MAG: glycosyltransferase [Lachnospiraceae bacterium]|nr:glycosyltransferase [Lachnospiraceae bacterium]
MEDRITVSVICATFNHEEFITDAIEGVLNQKVNFRFELIVHDDASTDKSAEIIQKYAREYPNIIHTVIQAENQYQHCRIYPTFLFPNVKGKFIAFCEGDDYWIDENKLQMQVDFLEAHPEYSMCMHNAIKLNYETGEEKLLDTFPEDGTYSQEQQILAGLGTDFPAFASYVFRADLLREIPDFFLASNVVDYPIRQYLASKGKIFYFKRPMSVYRSATPQSYMKKTAASQLFYNNYTLDMIRFFMKFNQYTSQKFYHILEDKLISDYFGFCLSIGKEEGLKKAEENGLDLQWILACYRCIDLKYLNESIREVYEKSEHFFIYGTSRLASVCNKQLQYAGMRLEGFVVSDGQMRTDFIDGKRVFYLSEVITKYKHPGFVLAVQPVNVEALENMLERYHMENYCKPYKIENCR